MGGAADFARGFPSASLNEAGFQQEATGRSDGAGLLNNFFSKRQEENAKNGPICSFRENEEAKRSKKRSATTLAR